MPHSHFLLSAKARTLSLREVFAMSDDQAFEAFREVRWGRDGEPECPACGVVAEHWFLPSRRQWRCRDCGHTFSVTSGTIFAHHKLPLARSTSGPSRSIPMRSKACRHCK